MSDGEFIFWIIINAVCLAALWSLVIEILSPRNAQSLHREE